LNLSLHLPTAGDKAAHKIRTTHASSATRQWGEESSYRAATAFTPHACGAGSGTAGHARLAVLWCLSRLQLKAFRLHSRSSQQVLALALVLVLVLLALPVLPVLVTLQLQLSQEFRPPLDDTSIWVLWLLV
jgi:hypothetical protein